MKSIVNIKKMQKKDERKNNRANLYNALNEYDRKCYKLESYSELVFNVAKTELTKAKTMLNLFCMVISGAIGILLNEIDIFTQRIEKEISTKIAIFVSRFIFVFFLLFIIFMFCLVYELIVDEFGTRMFLKELTYHDFMQYMARKYLEKGTWEKLTDEEIYKRIQIRRLGREKDVYDLETIFDIYR